MNLFANVVRSKLLQTTAIAAVASLPGVANAQLVRQSDLNSAIDSANNGGQLTVTDTSANQTDMQVNAQVVVAEWSSFNIGNNDTVNVTIDPLLGLTEATLFNRVIGSASTIRGDLNAAGINFWLINQNGVFFGDGAAINAKSFFASTLNVTDDDVFDFYLGTDDALNGTNTISFVGGTPGEIGNSGPPTAPSFTTDGTLMFVGDELDLTGSFDAGTGQVVFVSASDIDVTFDPGSPISYQINAGSTVAGTRRVTGSITGAGAEFAMFTDVMAVNSLLVDATIDVTTAVSTDRGVLLRAEGTGTGLPSITVNEAINSQPGTGGA
ncbi:MAG: filamentous hemagglutinin N-terminal domain-containing protein, partial [Erythrobacter sp.]|nr:filamentous hemagglutinin N-terminal domain-containing protein [Erythrobacter sp.]